MNKVKNLKISLIALSLVLISCASDKPTGKTEAEVLFKESKILIEDGRFILATEKLNHLKNQYPYSFYATPAELLQADILFKQENFVEAAAAYLLFRDFHPKHNRMPYVVYKIAESYFLQIPDTFDRDLQGAVESIKYYRELTSKYSKSEFVRDGKSKIAKCEKMLRSKEKYIADFYFKTEVYSAARWRYLDILESFKDKKLRLHSMQRIVASSAHLKEYDKCIQYADKYVQFLEGEGKTQVSEFRNTCAKK